MAAKMKTVMAHRATAACPAHAGTNVIGHKNGQHLGIEFDEVTTAMACWRKMRLFGYFQRSPERSISMAG